MIFSVLPIKRGAHWAGSMAAQIFSIFCQDLQFFQKCLRQKMAIIMLLPYNLKKNKTKKYCRKKFSLCQKFWQETCVDCGLRVKEMIIALWPQEQSTRCEAWAVSLQFWPKALQSVGWFSCCYTMIQIHICFSWEVNETKFLLLWTCDRIFSVSLSMNLSDSLLSLCPIYSLFFCLVLSFSFGLSFSLSPSFSHSASDFASLSLSVSSWSVSHSSTLWLAFCLPFFSCSLSIFFFSPSLFVCLSLYRTLKCLFLSVLFSICRKPACYLQKYNVLGHPCLRPLLKQTDLLLW